MYPGAVLVACVHNADLKELTRFEEDVISFIEIKCIVWRLYQLSMSKEGIERVFNE